KWHTGSGEPLSGLGAIGDFYLDASTGNFHEKTGTSAWTLRGNLKGPKGDKGDPGDGSGSGEGDREIIYGIVGDAVYEWNETTQKYHLTYSYDNIGFSEVVSKFEISSAVDFDPSREYFSYIIIDPAHPTLKEAWIVQKEAYEHDRGVLVQFFPYKP